MAALLFMTQPMLFGYAFISQKHIPFMILFMASIRSRGGWSGQVSRLAYAGAEVGRDPQRVDSSQGGRANFGGDWWKLSLWAKDCAGGIGGRMCIYRGKPSAQGFDVHPGVPISCARHIR